MIKYKKSDTDSYKNLITKIIQDIKDKETKPQGKLIYPEIYYKLKRLL